MQGIDKDNAQALRRQIISMYNAVNDDKDVTYITIVTTSMGPIKCNNLNTVKLHMLEDNGKGINELAYDYRLNNKSLEEVSNVFQQANIVNIDGLNQMFKIFAHRFYGGEIEMIRPKTEIIFEDTYFIAKNIECMEDRFKHAIVKYEDFEYMFTQ